MSVAFLIASSLATQGGVVSNSVSQPPVVAVTPTPPPPVIVATSPPPIVRPDYVNPYDRPVTTLRVRALAGGAVLFDDQMRVGRSGATFNQHRSEAGEGICPQNIHSTARNSLTINLRPDGPTKDSYRVNVSWLRPVTGCESQGSRGITLDQGVELQPGRTATVHGDGGLRVELTRQ